MLNVWPTRYVTGWDGVAEEMPGVYPVVDYRAVLDPSQNPSPQKEPPC